MMTKNEILNIYFGMAFTAENYQKWLDKPTLKKEDIGEITSLLNIYNKKLAKMEDENPWIANVLIAMEEPYENMVTDEIDKAIVEDIKLALQGKPTKNIGKTLEPIKGT